VADSIGPDVSVVGVGSDAPVIPFAAIRFAPFDRSNPPPQANLPALAQIEQSATCLLRLPLERGRRVGGAARDCWVSILRRIRSPWQISSTLSATLWLAALERCEKRSGFVAEMDACSSAKENTR